MMNFKMKNKTLFLCLPAMLNIPFGGSSAFGANSEKDNKENSPKRPNVLVLLTDDQTFSTIHAWGNNEIQTPNMDRLVNQGMSFTQTHVMGGLNGAISQPSRAMLLTGRGLMDVHRNGQVIPKNEKTFPELFRGTAIQPSEPANGTVTKLHSTVRSLRVRTFFSEECIPMEMKRKKRDTDALICMSTTRQGNTKMVNG